MKSLFYATMVCLMIATFAFGEVHPYGKRVTITFLITHETQPLSTVAEALVEF